MIAQPRIAHLGAVGRDVKAYQRALKAAGIRHRRATSHFRRATQLQVMRFQKRHGLTVDGIIGPRTYLAMSHLFDAYSKWLLAHTVLADTRPQRIVRLAMRGVADAASIHYAQTRPYPSYYHTPMTTDCSGFATLIYKTSGCPDPNAFGYNGYGYTGTMLNHGRAVSPGSPRVGDLIFYGRPVVEHVAIYVGAGKVVSHGSEGGPYLLPTYYRYDVNTARRYF